MYDAEVMAFAKDINEAFAHVAINTALDRVIDGRNAPFHLKENIEEPFRIVFEMFPVGDEHIVAYGFVAMIHCLFEGRDVLW